MVDDSTEDLPTRLDSPRTQVATPVSEGPRRVDAASATVEHLEFRARYQLVRELGRGGMGTVNLFHDQQIGRHVAMKQVSPQHFGREGVRRQFVHEARVQAQLEHPAVVPVYELAPSPEGHAFFTMKRVRGITLRQLVDRLREGDEGLAAVHTLRKRLSDLSRVCLAIDYAHRTGVVHRDLKPDNVMLGEYGEVYVLDWGIALLRPDDAPSPARVSDELEPPASISGTPGYVAPEQIIDGERVDGRADVYALGCLLFELLTLERPLGRGDGPALMRAALRGEVPGPIERAPQREIAPELDAICRRATARDPDQRYASARALHMALEHYLDGQRDEALRQTLAASHARRASAVEQRLRSGGAPGPDAMQLRREALHEVGRALALDPTNAAATQTMISLLTRPPEVTPPEVTQRLQQGTIERFRAAGRMAAVLYFALLLYLPLVVWAGIVDASAVGLVFGLSVVAGFVSLYAGLSPHPRESLVLVAMVVSMIAMGGTAALFGPLVLTPGIVAINGTAYAFTVGPRARKVTLVVGLLALVVPILLEAAGVVGPSYDRGADTMTILPRAMELGGDAAWLLLATASLGMVATGIFAVGYLRDALDRAERQLALFAWHFEQLLPGQVGRSHSGPG